MIQLIRSQALVDYRESENHMAWYTQKMMSTQANDLIWFLQHPGIYTGGPLCASSLDHGKSQKSVHFFITRRGGKMTYHDEGQRIIYLMVNLKKNQFSIHDFVRDLENWIIGACHRLGVKTFIHPGNPGVWTDEGKIASLGLHVSSGITSYGIAINLFTSKKAFKLIDPCGLKGAAISNLEDFNPKITHNQLDAALIEMCPFGQVILSHHTRPKDILF